MNVAKGDLAHIVNADISEAIGRTCQIIEPLGELYFDNYGLAFSWGVRLSHPCRDIDGGCGTDFAVPDFALRRITGLPDADSIDEQSPIVTETSAP